ncbi:uncharacterized protein LOC125141367 isoform X1 [Tachysurus fulvidraco]|uniref:uncharacterized protein LOC125141367 isoform X1 n=1 Tax=Tachysurus fulvidraco TaxID=1234273 RepID=UPI001FEED2C2|nr:uncharacterized protein LOC125141367 isoform X1 [Tachysurus fulvidraco]
MAAVCGHLWVALWLCLIGHIATFELEEQDWEYLGSDVVSLHRLKGLAHRFQHQTVKVQHDHRLRTPRDSPGHYENFKAINEWNKGTIKYSKTTNHSSLEWNSMAKAIFADLKNCLDIAKCILQKQQELNMFLETIEKKKTHEPLLVASEVLYSYTNKVILIMDNDPETLRKADDEYSEDPYYSIRADMTCLYSDLCLSMVTTGTVLRIIGSNSEDGNTLSGYTGNSLASLMTKLQKASLYSVTGSVSSTFRNNFLRGLTDILNSNVVLETTIQNEHVYQILDDTGATVEYKVPKRPVDQTTQYDTQHILIMQDDPVVRDAARCLYEKHPTVSSVYILENERPKLIKGDPVPLTEKSRLVLVGHGRRNTDGKMELAGYNAEKVADIIGHVNLEGNQIKTTSVVACEVGSDETFRNTLIKELHARSIETELHLRNSLLHVSHSAQKYTGEITPNGLVWKHNDDSKKTVVKMDRNGDVVTQIKTRNHAEVVFLNERDILGETFIDSWPEVPNKFVSMDLREVNTDALEGLTWAFFKHRKNSEKELVKKMNPDRENNDDYTIMKLDLNSRSQNTNGHTWYTPENIDNFFEKLYEIKSGEDILNLITHYAAVGEEEPTYLMLNDWIYKISEKNLYIFPVGKRLLEGEETVNYIQEIIIGQIGKHNYPDIHKGIKNCLGNEHEYAIYAKASLQGAYKRSNFNPPLSLEKEAWYSTLFLALVIPESARNFRSFPITLMAMDIAQSQNTETAKEGLSFLWKHPMQGSGTWTNSQQRGFFGSSMELIVDNNSVRNEKKKIQFKNKKLKELIQKENAIVMRWLKTFGNDHTQIDTENLKSILRLVYGQDYLNTQKSLIENFENSYKYFMKEIQSPPLTPGYLGGSYDGAAKLQDVHSTADVESSLKLSSYYSRSSVILAEHIQSELQRTFGEKVQELHVKSDSVMIQDGEFHCELVFGEKTDESTKWKLQLPEESKIQMKKMWKSMKKVSDTTTPHTVSGHLERAGMALGILGLMLGSQGAAHAFEQGDTKTGIITSLQTFNGVTGMTLAAVGKKVSVSAENKVVQAVSKVLKTPVAKRALAAFPIVGIGFGIYNIEEDLKRGDALGVIDATFDTLMVGLDVVEIAQPELTPIIIPLNLALNGIRLVFDDFYLDTQAELNKLPSGASVLDKIGAFVTGLEKGIFHFMCAVESFFVTIPYREIENGYRLVEEISDYHKYYSQREVEAGRKAIDFTAGDSSWNGGSITFCLSDDRYSEMCMYYFVSADEQPQKKCWCIDTNETNDIVLGIGESHQLAHSTVQIKIFLFIPVGSVSVVSGYEALTNSRYGKYSGNSKKNNFFAVQTNKNNDKMEFMLGYYYELYGKAGADTFYLGPQTSYVEGQGDNDIYIIPKDGGNTVINNYDPHKAADQLILGINYDQISVTRSGNDVVLQFTNDHCVRIKEWFTSETYRHINMMSADGILFDISTAVISSVKLVARGVNMMSKPAGQKVDTTEPLLLSVINIIGSPYNDRLIGNAQKNMINGGGGQDYMKGGEEEDVYVVNEKENSSVHIENYSRDKKMDITIIEANLHAIKTEVQGNNLILIPFSDDSPIVLINWFRSEEDRHLLVVTKDLITFSLSADRTFCSQSDPIHSKCILSQSIDYSESTLPLVIDLETDKAYLNVTYLHGSILNDDIKANAQENTIIPGNGTDFLQGRGGQDLYVVTPGYGLKTIDNFSPDLALDTLFIKEDYKLIAVKCSGTNLKLLINEREEVQLKDWFKSKMSQHLEVRTADGIIFNLQSNVNKCMDIKLPKSVDYRNRIPGQIMLMNLGEFVSVEKMYGSPGFDNMTGNDKGNWLDPFTGGGIMIGGEGNDTYVVKPEYGTRIEIDNFANDEKEDTVLFQAEFLSTPFLVEGENDDVIISAKNKGQNMMVRLHNYRAGQKHQHLSFQSADGVHFWVRSPITNQSGVLMDPWIEAYKVILKNKQLDCCIDLSSQKNLSTVYTVQGCSYQSNHIQGNDEDNALFGGMLHDILDGGDGHDILIGGQGNDILLGNSGNDTLYGEDGDDTMLGGSGWDSFIPGPGADMIDGGPGRDTVLYQGDHKTGEGVYVNLLSGEGHQADAEGDVLKDLENVIGTIYSDILVSGYEPAILKGSDGDDVLVSVAEGDYLIGGEGRDIYFVVPHRGLITIDNCAEDNAMDILYLPSVTYGSPESKESSTGMHLIFPLFDSTFMDIFIKDWISDGHKCGHLTVIMPEHVIVEEKKGEYSATKNRCAG